jgi:hypothetical protein
MYSTAVYTLTGKQEQESISQLSPQYDARNYPHNTVQYSVQQVHRGPPQTKPVSPSPPFGLPVLSAFSGLQHHRPLNQLQPIPSTGSPPPPTGKPGSLMLSAIPSYDFELLVVTLFRPFLAPSPCPYALCHAFPLPPPIKARSLDASNFLLTCANRAPLFQLAFPFETGESYPLRRWYYGTVLTVQRGRDRPAISARRRSTTSSYCVVTVSYY